MTQPTKYGVSGDPPPRLRPIPPVQGIDELNPADLDKVINSDHLTMVEFYTRTCSACRTFDMTLGKASDTLTGKVAMYRIEDPNLDISRARFGIPGYPSTVFFYKGQRVATIIGAMEWKYFVTYLQKAFATYLTAIGQESNTGNMTFDELVKALPPVPSK